MPVSNPRSICAYCDAAATSVDHIPPKSIFTGDKSNLITVPACDTHNNAQSEADEQFRTFVALKVGARTPETQKLWMPMARGISRNGKYREQINEMLAKSVWVSSRGEYAIEISVKHFRIVTERITRGLYFHHFKERLPVNATVTILTYDENVHLEELVASFPGQGVIGGGQFEYAYWREEEEKFSSYWVYRYFGEYLGFARTRLDVDRVVIDQSNSS